MNYKRYNSIEFELDDEEKVAFEKVIAVMKNVKERFRIADMNGMAEEADKARTLLVTIYQGQMLEESKRL